MDNNSGVVGDKVDFRQAQLLYGRALRTVHSLALRSTTATAADDPAAAAALLAAAATDLQAAWTQFVADRERLLEVVRHLARVTVVRTMRARRPRAGPGKVASPAARLRTPCRAPSSPAAGTTSTGATTTTAVAAAATAAPGTLSPTAASPRRLRRPGRSPATVMGPRVGGTLAVRRKLRFGEGSAAVCRDLPLRPSRTSLFLLVAVCMTNRTTPAVWP
jgi:hypothetical protein